MKLVLMILLGLFFSTSVFAQNMVGTWVWVGSGCRDKATLSRASHVSLPNDDNPFGITGGTFNLNSDLSVSMILYVNIKEEKQTVTINRRKERTGTYRVKNNKVLIFDPKISVNEPLFLLNIIGDYLVACEKACLA